MRTKTIAAIAFAVSLAVFAFILSGMFWLDGFTIQAALALGVPVFILGFVILGAVAGQRRA